MKQDTKDIIGVTAGQIIGIGTGIATGIIFGTFGELVTTVVKEESPVMGTILDITMSVAEIGWTVAAYKITSKKVEEYVDDLFY